MAQFVMGDFHGAYKALMQCLDRSGFDRENDTLIQLGDVADGFPQVYECVEELLKIRHLVPLKGNHDAWFDEFIKTELHPYFWQYGGEGTLNSYLAHAGKPGRYRASSHGYKTALEPSDIPTTHQEFFDKQLLYHIDKDNRLFVHAGFNRKIPFNQQHTTDFYWDRTLWADALHHHMHRRGSVAQDDFVLDEPFKEIYIGHTPTTNLKTDIPLRALNIFNVDTGAGHAGKLTIMNVDTKQYWQSDSLKLLYNSKPKIEPKQPNRRQRDQDRSGPGRLGL